MKELFQTLGLNEKETHAFLKMLELGAQAISVIAKHVGVPRSSMYVILDKLKRRNLIEEFERNGITYVKCIPVKNIPDLLKAKISKIEHVLKISHERLSFLEGIENKLGITPSVKFFEDKEEIMRMYEVVLKEKEFYAFFNPKLVKKVMPQYYYKIGETIKANRGSLKEILVSCPEAYKYKEKFNSRYHQIKILPKEISFSSDTIICRDKIYMIAYGESNVLATEIINPSLATTQWILFEQLWKSLP